MARVTKNQMGLSGKVGNIVFITKKNGNTHARTAPTKYTTSYTEPAIEGREKFVFFNRLGQVISSNFTLDHFWRQVKLPGHTGNKIMKLYYHDIQSYDISNIGLVVSEDQFTLTPESISLDEVTFEVVIGPLPANEEKPISVINTPVITAQGFVFLYNPAKKTAKNKFIFLPLASENLNTVMGQELKFRMKITYSQLKQMSKFPKRNILINLALKDLPGKPHRFSRTVFHEF